MAKRFVVFVFCFLLMAFCFSGCITRRMSAKEHSYSIAMQILCTPSKADVFYKIKCCEDVVALRIVAFAANAAAWPIEAGEDVDFENTMNDMSIMALNRLFEMDSDDANESIEYYKRSFPPDGAYGVFFKEWESRRKFLNAKHADATRGAKSPITIMSPQKHQP